MLSDSVDKGQAWSAPKPIGDDQKSAGPAGGPDDFMPAVAVSKDGVVGVRQDWRPMPTASSTPNRSLIHFFKPPAFGLSRLGFWIKRT